ncbi:MAG: DUF6522 family protein [Gemmobacter sp.]|uniref:DUF6522 family protein n=1 Tax=Gemmobacter sp. TaxID=1898957 RepID=UPI00391A81F5
MAVTFTAQGFEVDAAAVAAAFELDPASLREMMRAGEVASLCEKGEGVDAGRFRLIFRHAGRVLRLTVDGDGHILTRATFDSPRSTGRAHRPQVQATDWLCCTDFVKDSPCKSSVIAGGRPQAERSGLQGPEVACV